MAKNDLEIKELIGEIKELFSNAIMGVTKNKQINLSPEFNADVTADIYKQSVKEVLKSVLNYVQKQVEENGSIGVGDEKFYLGLQSLSLDSIKNQVLIDSGLPLNEDLHPQQVFAFAIAKFTRENPKFNEKINKVEKFNQDFMQKMFIPNANFAQL